MNRRDAVLAMLTLGAALLATIFALPTLAQTWPAKPIRLIVPYPPGGQTDTMSRYLADKLRPVFGQSILVENKPGAGGIIGIEAAKNSAPDGYTFVYIIAANVCINPFIYEKLPYDGLRDFVPVTHIGGAPLAMVVSAALNIKTLPEFITYAKANPGKVSFASYGTGSASHIFSAMLNSLADINMTHVAYKGAGPAVQDIMAGHATTGIHDFSTVGQLVRSGKLVALAVTGPQHWPLFPDVPTFAEQGYPLDMVGWNGILAPAGTSRAIVERMGKEINRIIQTPEGREQILKLGLLATGTTPEEFSAIILRDTARWGDVIRKAGIKAD
jgi:tripartite-type tricarboxylate transporter receptor subunit TctC